MYTESLRIRRFKFDGTASGQLFTKSRSLKPCWHQDSESRLTAVTSTIGRIRQKIEDDRAAPSSIFETVSNLGYQFVPNIGIGAIKIRNL
ncbi:MAG: helix-turn-helix domain-containing protein [Faecalibacterium prausnitzii]